MKEDKNPMLPTIFPLLGTTKLTVLFDVSTFQALHVVWHKTGGETTVQTKCVAIE